jgi:hypothetical protein
MRQIVCNYAPIRFLPYREVGEFVTIGVVVHCPQTDFFDYRLTKPKRTSRVTGFFPELDIGIFKAALEGAAREFDRAKKTYGNTMVASASLEMAQSQMRRFQEYVRRREGLLHFGQPGTRLTDDPKLALNDLFEHYVNRQFTQKPEYQETIMRKRLAQFLKDWNLSKYYEFQQIGDADFHVKIPFVHLVEKRVIKAIKPLDLDKIETTDVYQHGGVWVKNMERLKARGQLPNETVFAIQFPKIGRPFDAAKTIVEELEQLGVRAIDFSLVQQVKGAVDIHQSPGS